MVRVPTDSHIFQFQIILHLKRFSDTVKIKLRCSYSDDLLFHSLKAVTHDKTFMLSQAGYKEDSG